MKSILLSAFALSLAFSVLAEEKPPQLKDLKDKVSYSIGLREGFTFQSQNLELKKLNTTLNGDAFLAGIKDALDGRKPLLTDQDVKETMMAFEKDMQQKQSETAQKNGAEADKFLAANKTKEGVKTTESGLQYKVLKEGSGAQPKSSDTVTVNYRGTLMDGTEFDSSYKRGQPASFQVGGVIKGWTEALQLMKVGSKYQLFIPADLAYGPSGQRGIPPNSILIFEVELVGIQGSQSPSPSPK